MDIAGFTQKVVSLEAELQDISSQESKDEASLAKVKKQLRDLEAKVKDQEEELDEQAGTIQMLEQVLGQVDADITMFRADSGQAPKAPGMKYRHYAPKGELTIVQGAPEKVAEYINSCVTEDVRRGEKTGVIGTQESALAYQADVVKIVGSRQDEEGIAKHLYTFLREFDDEKVTRIYSESFSQEGFGQAIMNRLLKAAGHKVIVLDDTK